MSLLKFNNIRDLSDARFASAAMAEWIGFTVGYDDSLSPAAIQEIVAWCAGPSIVLELSENIERDAVLSVLDVIPAQIIECTPEQKANLCLPDHLDFILLSDDNTPGITHSEMPSIGKHILRIGHQTPGQIISENPYGISFTCSDSDDPALKNFDYWTSFLEDLGVF